MSVSKSGIPYLTHVWNPVVGCTRGCGYCWARPLARRIGAAIGCTLCEDFTPHVHQDRLRLPGGEPKVIGLGFMTELWAIPDALAFRDASGHVVEGDTATWLWLPLLRQMEHHPEHTFVTATKHPAGIPEGFEPPEDWWLLVTCDQSDTLYDRLYSAWERWSTGNIVLNLEPWCTPWTEDIVRGCHDDPEECPTWYDWCNCLAGLGGVIVGGMSGPKAKDSALNPDWVRVIRDQCAAAGVPFAYKQGNGGEQWPELDGRRHTDLAWGGRP